MQTEHADKNCPQSMHTEHPDMICRQNIHTHYAHIHVCRLNPHTNFTTRRCRQIMQTEKQKEHADKVYRWANAVETCRLNMQKNVTDRTCRKKNMYVYIDYANKLFREKTKNMQLGQTGKTCRQNKWTIYADRTCTDLLQLLRHLF